MSLATIPATVPAPAPQAAADDEPFYPPPAATMTVALAKQMAGTAYHEASQRVVRLARQLLPQAVCPDDRMRLLFLYAAEETYLAGVFPAVHPQHPERWQTGVTAHQLTGELAAMIAHAEEAIAAGHPYRPGGFETDTEPYLAQAMAYYVTDPNPMGRAGVLDTLAQHLRTRGFPPRAVELVADVAAGLRVTAIGGNRPLPGTQ
ncbi:hypothetical protein [Amycolatopsis rifamycinica]|uniref:Uncharacterized protein n=1 Tax=Amycolatopsis rifamycinica TaxID=287986 RepID=A0A066U708_9PSEU|nr:hypothetical protein [Amycolatopsis rifamycinica]KDN23221.1 hypothetical protein DV20_05750 [Amycolatopsis rifamycinica]